MMHLTADHPAPRQRTKRPAPGQFLYIALLFCQPVLAAPPTFELPIRCSPGQDCFIQNYFDHDTGSGWKDYACGHLSYDGHSGTDFRLPGMAAVRQGVTVVAAANGVVAGLRDGEPDVPALIRPGEPDSGKHAAGNAVRIDHGDGWETQYSHMRQGSVAVRVGQQVHAGDPLGMVGLSGNTEFPHVDFAVRHHGHPVDPFAPYGPSACAGDVNSLRTDTLWKPEVLNALRYIPTGVLLAGWTGVVPDRNKARSGEYPNPRADASALVFWVEVFGVQMGDQQTFAMFDPQHRQMLTSASTIPGNKAAWFGYAGKPRPPQGWSAGTYRAEYRLKRKGVTVITTTRHLEIP